MLFIKYPQLEEHVRALHKPPATSCYTPFIRQGVLVLPLTVCKMLHCYLQFMVSVVQKQAVIGYTMLSEYMDENWIINTTRTAVQLIRNVKLIFSAFRGHFNAQIMDAIIKTVAHTVNFSSNETAVITPKGIVESTKQTCCFLKNINSATTTMLFKKQARSDHLGEHVCLFLL